MQKEKTDLGAIIQRFLIGVIALKQCEEHSSLLVIIGVLMVLDAINWLLLTAREVLYKDYD